MKAQTLTTYTRLSLSLVFSLLMFAVLLLSLSQATKAELNLAPTNALEEVKRPNALDSLSAATVCCQTPNLVPNPGFEQADGWPNRWNHYGADADCVFNLDVPGHDTSANSVSISTTTDITDNCVVYTNIDEISVEPGRYYDYSAWVKSDLVRGAIFLRLTFWSRQEDPPRWYHRDTENSASVTDTSGDWTQVSGSVQAPGEAEYLRVEAFLAEGSKGSVMFDDIYFGLATCLEISKHADPDPVNPGQKLTYTIVFSNTGRERATDLEIVDTYDKYVDSFDFQRFLSKGDKNWKIPELGPGASDAITVMVKVRNDARSWLFNRAEVLSNETIEPVSAIRHTKVNTEAAAVFIDPPEQSVTATLGQPTESTIALHNLGSCEGRTDLAYHSSLSGTINLAPSPPYTLAPGTYIPVTMSHEMPKEAIYAGTDVTVISATLNCVPTGTMAITTSTATAILTTIVPFQLFLPEMTKGFAESAFLGPWEVEDNDDCRANQVNGLLTSGRQYYGYSDDKWDYFGIDLHSGGKILTGLTIAPTRHLQLVLLDKDCKVLDPYAWDPPYLVEIPDASAGQYYIGVFMESGYTLDQPYILWAEFP